jgi:hypothetical protein
MSTREKTYRPTAGDEWLVNVFVLFALQRYPNGFLASIAGGGPDFRALWKEFKDWLRSDPLRHPRPRLPEGPEKE